jgi:hypothetical protein
MRTRSEPLIFRYDRTRGAMTVRESVHRLVDTLPEDRLADALDYLSDLNDTAGLSEETGRYRGGAR